jgi:hypothetical protein
MKKLSVRLSLLCLLALLLVPFAGCKKDEGGEEATATTDTTMTTDTMTTEPMATTDMGTMSTDMGTDMGTSEPMTTESTPPAGQ